MAGRGRGNVKVYIDGDPSGLGRATKQAETYLGGLGSSVSKVGDKLASAGKTLNRNVTLPVLAIGAVAGKTAIDFDKSMRNVNSIAQLPERGLQRLEKRVLGLAGPTAQAPRTLAEGLYDLVSSGFDANESLFILDKSARAATAGLTTTEVSTASVAAVLNAYHLKADKAGQVSDRLFETVNRGVISFEDLATTIGDVLPFASSLHVSLDEVGASVSTMTKEGISAPETMTRIKNVMVTLLKPGKALSDVLDELGVSGEELVRKKGFQGALEAIIARTDGSKEAITELFPNIRALGGVLALTGGNARTAAGDLKAFTDTSGATDKALSQQSKSTSYKWNKFKAELEETAIKAAPTFLDAAKEVVGELGDMVKWFDKLSPSTKRMIINVGLLGAALGPVLTIGGNLLKVVGGTIRIADKASAAFRTIGAGAAAAGSTTATASGAGAAGAGSTGRLAGVRSSLGTYDLARSFGRGRGASAVAQVGATGAAMASSIAGGLAAAAGPAIAAVGVGNILSSAIEGDTKSAAYKAGGGIAGAVAGGIAGTFLGGNTALGAMIGGGVGTFLGDALSGVFESEKKLTPMQRRLQVTAKQVSVALKSQGEAAEKLAQAQQRLDGANRRHRRSTDEVKDAQQSYQQALRTFGPSSLPALQAALRLARAERQEEKAADAAKRAHELNGIQLELFKVRTTRAIAAESRRIPVLRHTVDQLTKKWRKEKDNEQLSKRLEGKLKALADHESKRNRVLKEAEAISPKWARGLERMGSGVAKFVTESGRVRGQLEALPQKSESVTQQLERQWGTSGGLLRAIRNFKGETKTQLQQQAAKHMQVFRDQGAGAFGSLAERVYTAEQNIGGNTTSLLEGLGASKVPKFKLTAPITGGKGRNQGGMVRVPGVGREDTVPLYGRGIEAMVAPGEDLIVANRHQRPELDYAVANTYGDKGLSGFFSRSRRPHNFATGGIARDGGANALGAQAAQEVLRRIGMADKLPLPQIAGPEPLAGGVGQGSVNLVFAAAADYLRRHAGSPRVRKMIAFAEREAAKGYPYVYGGGHGGFSGPYDCSGFVSAILHAGNFLSTPMSVQQGSGLYTFGEAGAGKQVTWGVRGTSGENAHTMISLKDVEKGWRFFEAGSGHGAAEVGGWAGSFSYRHPEGFARGGIALPRGRDLAKMPPRVRKALARHGAGALDPRSPHFVGWGYQRGGMPRRFAGGGVVVQGRATWFTGGATAGGSSTSKPGLALNLDTSKEPEGWDNPTTQGWMEASRAGKPVYAQVSIGGKSANLPITDVGPASWTGNSIDVTAGGVHKLGFTTDTFPSGTVGKAVVLGEGKEKKDPDQIPVHGRSKLSYEEKISKLDARIAKAGTTATLKDDRRAAAAKLGLLRQRKGYLEKKIQGINKKLKGKLKPPVRERLLQEREGFLGELAGMPGEASGLIESLRESGVTNPKQLKKYAKGFGIGVADPNAERPTARDRADLQLARAEMTGGKEDDLAALQKLVDVSKEELKAAKKSGDPKKIAEATRNLKDAADALRDATPTAQDFANRDLALAELTEGIDDDRAALEQLKALAEQELAVALQTADPLDDIEAAHNLKAVKDSLDSLTATLNETEQQRQEFEEERLALDKKLVALAEAQGPAFMAAWVAYIDGAIGGPLQTRNRLATAGSPAAYQ